jgi:Sec-independent protein translocase protein TatA
MGFFSFVTDKLAPFARDMLPVMNLLEQVVKLIQQLQADQANSAAQRDLGEFVKDFKERVEDVQKSLDANFEPSPDSDSPADTVEQWAAFFEGQANEMLENGTAEQIPVANELLSLATELRSGLSGDDLARQQSEVPKTDEPLNHALVPV